MTHLVLKDELLDAQTVRAVGTAPYGGADVGECLVTALAVDGTDLTSWHSAWTSTARTVLALAESEHSEGRMESARLAYFRASSYFRTAGTMLMGAPWTRGWSSLTPGKPVPSGPAPRCSGSLRRSC